MEIILAHKRCLLSLNECIIFIFLQIENSYEECIFVWHYLRGEIIGKSGAHIKKVQGVCYFNDQYLFERYFQIEKETNVQICFRDYNSDFDRVLFVGKRVNVLLAKRNFDKYELKSVK